MLVYVHQRVKALLRMANLPATCWPLAATYAAKHQRNLALNNLEDKDLVFGAPTHVKFKMFGQGGRYDLMERWEEGKYVGYSEDVVRGKVVRLPSGSYNTSVHIRPHLVDADDLVEMGPLEMDFWSSFFVVLKFRNAGFQSCRYLVGSQYKCRRRRRKRKLCPNACALKQADFPEWEAAAMYATVGRRSSAAILAAKASKSESLT